MGKQFSVRFGEVEPAIDGIGPRAARTVRTGGSGAGGWTGVRAEDEFRGEAPLEIVDRDGPDGDVIARGSRVM